MSTGEIGKAIGVPPRLVRGWLKVFGIATRSHAEAGAISAARYLDKRVLVKCSVCGKEIRLHLYRAKKVKRPYCSRACQITDCQDSLTMAVNTYRPAHPRIMKVCPVCGRSFSVPFSHKEKRFNCSQQCNGVARVMQNAARKQPTKPEQRIIDVAYQFFPDFQYNGRGDLGIVLGGMIPDFVNTNGKKQVIEVFGDYYHSEKCKSYRYKASEEGRIKTYSSIGYQCLVLWERDIKRKSDLELALKISTWSSIPLKRRTPYG